VEAAARALIAAQTQGLPGEITIEISPLDAANHLPPCLAPVAFLPSAARAWGAFSVGVRCDAPVVWTVYLKAQVKVAADYLVTARAVPAGQIVGPDDIELRHGNIAALADDVLTDASQALGRPARFSLAADRPVQRRMLRIPAAVKQGNDITVVSGGPGFTVSNTGRALNSAAPGETVRVRLPNSRVVSGTARADGAVDIDE
jgi:flagella basal body P-ring formation protein FlgA